MKSVPGRIIADRPISDEDWDEEDCLCQDKVPEDKRVDYLHRVYSEKQQKWRWRPFLRYHIECPIHGVNRESLPCHAE